MKGGADEGQIRFHARRSRGRRRAGDRPFEIGTRVALAGNGVHGRPGRRDHVCAQVGIARYEARLGGHRGDHCGRDLFVFREVVAQRAAAQALSGALRRRGPYPFEIELTPAALVTTQAGTRSEHAWSTIVEVKDSPDAIDFVARGAGIIVVRNRAFRSDTERREFLELARKFTKTRLNGTIV